MVGLPRMPVRVAALSKDHKGCPVIQMPRPPGAPAFQALPTRAVAASASLDTLIANLGF